MEPVYFVVYYFVIVECVVAITITYRVFVPTNPNNEFTLSLVCCCMLMGLIVGAVFPFFFVYQLVRGEIA